MAEQSAVEWLINQVEDFCFLIPVDIIEEAKEIDKQRGEILRSRFITSVLAEFLHCQTSSNIQHSFK